VFPVHDPPRYVKKWVTIKEVSPVTKAEKEESGIDHVIRPFRTPNITPLLDFQPAPSVKADFVKKDKIKHVR